MPSDLLFDATEVGEGLANISFRLDKKSKTNFYYLHKGVLVFNEEVYDSDLFTSFEFAGEIIELNMERDLLLFLCNILSCHSYINYKKSIFGKDLPNGEKEIIEAAFHADRMECGSSLFKLPENASQAIYCSSYAADHDFFSDYHRLGFSGLVFKEIASYKMATTSNGWALKEVKK
jgi:hypothetical protein